MCVDLFIYYIRVHFSVSFPYGTSGKESTCQCRRSKRHGFHPWVGESPWRKPQQPAPVLLPGESHGQRSLAGYGPWGGKQLGTTWVLNHHHARFKSLLLVSWNYCFLARAMYFHFTRPHETHNFQLTLRLYIIYVFSVKLATLLHIIIILDEEKALTD